MKYRQSPIGALKGSIAHLSERSGRLHGARAVSWTHREEESIPGGGLTEAARL